MQVTLAATEQASRASVLRRAAPIACGCALAGAAVYLAGHDPYTGGYPACPMYTTTGLWCPACGLTRATYHLLHGQVGAALSANLFVPLVLAAIAAAWWGWLRSAWGFTAVRLTTGTGRFARIWLPLVLVLYGVLRNIPAAPFRSLAP